MSKLNISLNGTEYSIDESVLSEAKASLKSHLSSTMSGEGATINFEGVSYSVDSTKLSSARNDLITHLGTMSGNGPKITVNGVEYSMDSTKISETLTKMHNAFNNLIGGLPQFTHGQTIEEGGLIYQYVSMTTLEEWREGLKQMLEAETGMSWEDLLAAEGLDEETAWEMLGATEENFVPQEPAWNVIQYSDDTVTDIQVKGEIEGIPVSINEGVFSDCGSIVSVVIGDGVTSIGDGAFEKCASLHNITIPDSVTSIGEYAFHECVLASVTIGNGVTSIGSFAFMQCGGLTDIVIPASVTHIGNYAFAYNRLLTSIIFEGTVDQWSAIGGTPFYGIPATYVQCSDGQVAI